MSACETVRDQLLNYIEGRISQREFARWFWPVEWNTEEDDPEYGLIGDVALRLAEYDYMHWTDEELQQEMSKLLITHPAPHLRTGTSSVTYRDTS